MQILRRKAYARAGLIGNPSDGYNGKTISVIVKNFWAEVVLYEWPELEILLTQEDQNRFSSVNDLVKDVGLHGYYGGIRLVKATIKKFAEYCARNEFPLHDRNFSIRYSTNIPRQVGLAGSSAIITATMRALMDFYEVTIPERVQPSFVLDIEKNELGIQGGLQDRVIQVYEGAVYMDFAKDRMETVEGFLCGHYEPMNPSLLPPLYIAYSEDAGEPTEVTHMPLRIRYDQGDPEVVGAMKRFAEITQEFRRALESGDRKDMSRLMDANYDLRERICNLSPTHREMIHCARSVGASAKFAGSGGAIIGTYEDESMYQKLCMAMHEINCRTLKPIITTKS